MVNVAVLPACLPACCLIFSEFYELMAVCSLLIGRGNSQTNGLTGISIEGPQPRGTVEVRNWLRENNTYSNPISYFGVISEARGLFPTRSLSAVLAEIHAVELPELPSRVQ